MKTYLTERFHRELEKVLSIHNGKAYGRDGQLAPRRICLLQTQRDRSSFYVLAFGQLAQMGYRLEGPEGLNEKHVHALAKRWLMRPAIRKYLVWSKKLGKSRGFEAHERDETFSFHNCAMAACMDADLIRDGFRRNLPPELIEAVLRVVEA